MIEIIVRLYTEPTLKKDMPLPEANDLPDNFMGITVKANEKVRSQDENIKRREDILLDYIMPRIQSVMQCIGTGDPPVVVTFAPDAEKAMGKMIEQIIAETAMSQATLRRFTPKNPSRMN